MASRFRGLTRPRQARRTEKEWAYRVQSTGPKRASRPEHLRRENACRNHVVERSAQHLGPPRLKPPLLVRRHPQRPSHGDPAFGRP
jgi:hypothetical protein